VPLHVVSGDEDDNCLEPDFIKRVVPVGVAHRGPAPGMRSISRSRICSTASRQSSWRRSNQTLEAADARALNKSTLAKKGEG